MSNKKIVPKINYLEIFFSAFKLVLKNRFLWWFGFFLVLNVVFDPNYIQNENVKIFFLGAFFSKRIALASFVAIISSIIFFISLILSLIAKGALIKATQFTLEKKDISFVRGWTEGKKYFWINFKIIFFSSAIFFFCVFILWIPVLTAFHSGTYFIAIVLAILAILISIPLLVLYKFIQAYACFYATLADLNIWLALENAYALFKKNILNSLIMFLLDIMLEVFSFLAVVIVSIPFVFVFRLIDIIFYSAMHKNGASVVFSLIIILFALSILVFYSIFSAILQVAWSLFFYEIAAPKKEKKLEESILEPEKQLNEPATVNSVNAVRTDSSFDENDKSR